jgi:NADH:ubiquinone oxidoreductase subunit B-like Fe-S oxidoreductase
MKRRMKRRAKSGATANHCHPTPQALLQRAQALAEKIKQTEQKTRAAELARLLKIKPEAALAQLQAEEKRQDAKNPSDAPKPSPPTPAAAIAIAQLQQQARSALERQQQRDKQREQGTLLTAVNMVDNKAQGGAGGSAGTGVPATGSGFSDPRV